MNDLAKHITALRKEAHSLEERLFRVKNAIAALTGESEQKTTTHSDPPRTTTKRPKWSALIKGAFTTTARMNFEGVAETVGLQEPAAKTSRGRSAIKTTLQRLVNGGALQETSGEYCVVDLNRAGKKKPIFSNTETVEDVAIRVLKRVSEPMHYAELMDVMRSEENFEIGGKDPKSTMTAHLSNSKKIIRFGKGVYGLSDWKPREANTPIEFGDTHGGLFGKAKGAP